MRRLIGQNDDMYTMQCKDGCKIDLHIEGRAADGEVFLHNSSYTNLSVGAGVLPQAVESALELVRMGQEATFAVKVPIAVPICFMRKSLPLPSSLLSIGRRRHVASSGLSIGQRRQATTAPCWALQG